MSIYKIESPGASHFARQLGAVAPVEVYRVRVNVDEFGLTLKVNEGGWSAPYRGDWDTAPGWDADHAEAHAYVQGRADAIEAITPNGQPNDTARTLRGWANSFAIFYAGRPSNISGMEGERTLAEWFRYWRFVEEDDSPDDLPDWHGDADPLADACGVCRADTDQRGDGVCTCEPRPENEE